MAGRIAYLGNIATQGLVLNLDATIKGSYPGTGTTWTDVSNNGNNGTLTNGPTFSSADYGSIVFDGVDDYVVIPSSTTITPRTGDFTNDFWINPTLWTNNNWQPVQVTAITNGLWIGQNQNNQFVVRAYGVADRLQYAIRPATGSWTDVSITRNNNLITLYYNGTPVSSSTSNQDFLQATTYLGSDGASGGGGAVYFTGRIASDRYYNIGLSQFQVWNNFNSYKSRYSIPDIVTDGLVLNLDAGNPYSYLSGSSGTTWTNVAPVNSNLSGSLINGTRYSNGAMVFDGVDDKVILPAGITFSYGTGDFTLDGWFYVTKTLPQYGERIFTQTISGTNYFVFQVGSDEIVSTRNIEFVFATLGSGTRVSSSTTWEYNTWNYFTVSRINGTVIVYLNAVPGSAVSCTQDFNNTTYIPTIGQYTHTSAESFGGRISNIRLYKGKGLTQAEITQNFNALRGRYGI
jgi:hypothetical protein